VYIILQKGGQFRWQGGSSIIIVACLEIQLRNARLYSVEVECLCNEYQQRLIQVDQGREELAVSRAGNVLHRRRRHRYRLNVVV
jgi:hypothetical protein